MDRPAQRPPPLDRRHHGRPGDRHEPPALLRSRDGPRRSTRARRASEPRPGAYSPALGRTLAEKILLAHPASTIAPGDVVMVRCDVVMTNDISGPIAFRTMREMGVDRVFDPARVVLIPDHFVPAKDARSAELQRRAEATGPTSRASSSTGRGAAASSTRCCSRTAGWCRARWWRAATRTPARTARSERSAPGSARPTSRAAWPSASSGRSCPARSRSSSRGTKSRWVSGKDLILAVLAEIGVNGGTGQRAGVRRRRRRGADHRRAAGRRQHGGRGGLGDGHLPGRRHHRGLPRGPHRHAVDRRAHRPGRRARRHGAHRPRRAAAARGAAALAGQRGAAGRRRSARASTRSTSATARTGR